MTAACEGCGAATEYAPGTNVLRCPYCGTERPLPAPDRPVMEHSFDALVGGPRAPARDFARQRYVCQGCGARLQGDAVSQRCQFCTAPLVVDTGTDHQVAPEAVLPFALDRGAAREALRGWTRSRWFAPTRLKQVTEAETMASTYLPHWTFDARTVSRYRGEQGTHYWETEYYTETVDGKSVRRSRQVQKTRWRHVTGTVARDFDDVLVTGTRRVDDRTLGKLGTWPLAQVRPYQAGYVAGHESLRYDVEPEVGLELAKQRMAVVIGHDCRNDIGGDEQRVHAVETRYGDVTYKLVLLPVWMGSYLYGGKPWSIVVNGVTGVVYGSRPYSAAKISSLVLAVLLVVLAVFAAYRLGFIA
ncbi:hypothetical protein [Actinomadura harenae]|uniref:Zinc ribbon domain-containing protein n=1 Tax=Actinomadura harenae TaxID=2483351 RepID=A0A3M2LRR5_9ACTN|nr:hypothetical protein [Actinomadura harenae]RMI40151.1 hypothetical protein EBO15_27605 [Actinomadura harenae]